MPPDPRLTLPPRLLDRLDAIDWPETVEQAERAVGAQVSVEDRGGRPIRWRTYPEAVADWLLGGELVDAILDTVGPSAAGILRRRVVLIGGDGAKTSVAIKRIPAPANDLAGADLVFAVDARHALALLAPPAPEATMSHDGGRLYLVRLLDHACSIVDDAGRVRRTVPHEPSWHVARWGSALTPNAAALVEFGRTLPRAQLSLDDDLDGGPA